MQPDGGTIARDGAWPTSPEVARAIRRAATSFATRKGAVSLLVRGTRAPLDGVRFAICDDSPVFLAGLAASLGELGVSVTLQAKDFAALETRVLCGDVDAAIIDIAMPPTYTIEGISAARRIRAARPGFPILLLSTSVDTEGDDALAALQEDGSSLGYLRKDRLTGGSELEASLVLLLDGGTVVDADVVSTLLAVTQDASNLNTLTGRERQTLGLVAQGLTNSAIAAQMFLSPKTVEANIASLFNKLGLPVEATANRRVLATLTYLKAVRSTLHTSSAHPQHHSADAPTGGDGR